MSEWKTGSDERIENYPLNCWYVAATADEVGPELLGREILGRPVLIYRTEAGQAVAMADLCPHRAVALSRGGREGDLVVCGYHGSKFAADGRCVQVPSQGSVPYNYSVQTYPVREEGPIIWIWLGEPGRAGHRLPPETPWLSDDEWTVLASQRQVAANYLLLHDNSVDFTHLPHVHQELSPQGYRSQPPSLDIEVSEYSVSYRRTFPAGPIPAWQAEVTGLDPDRRAVIQESGAFLSPALHVVHMDIHVPDPGLGEHGEYLRPWVRAFTPINPYQTRVFSWVARNYRRSDESVSDALEAIHDRLMTEDADVIEQMYEHNSRYAAGIEQHLVNADVTAMRVHEIVHHMLARERTQTFPRRPMSLSNR